MKVLPFVYDHFVTTLSNNLWGSGDLFLSLRALREGSVDNLFLTCALLLLFVMAVAVAEAEAVAGDSHWRAWCSFRFLSSKPL